MATTYGIELEVSNLSIPSARRVVQGVGLNWESKADGTSGVSAEIVSPILSHETLPEARTIARALSGAGATVNKQTGYHVHLGAETYGQQGIATLVYNWYSHIEAIATLVAPSRLNNRFCASNLTRAEVEQWSNRIANTGQICNPDGYSRYLSLNLNSFSRHRTVEVRLHHGTLNGAKITAWAEFCDAIARYSADLGQMNQFQDDVADTRLNRVNAILDLLSIDGGLAPATRDYLKQRAQQLGGN